MPAANQARKYLELARAWMALQPAIVTDSLPIEESLANVRKAVWQVIEAMDSLVDSVAKSS